MWKNRIEMIVFDWGGTLAYVDGQIEALTRGASVVVELLTGRNDHALATDLAQEAMRAEKRAAMDPAGREVDLADLLDRWAMAHHGYTQEKAMIEQAINAIGEHWVGHALSVIPRVPKALQQLHQNGYRLGLVSNCWIPPRYCRAELNRQGLDPLLDFAVFSSEVSYRKPSPHIFEAAISKAYPNGAQRDLSRVLFVGDSPTCDIMAPAALGMRTAMVATPPGVWPPEDVAAARPDLHIRSVAELPALMPIRQGDNAVP